MPSSGKCRQAWRPISTGGHGGKSSSNVEAKRAWRAGKMDLLNPPSCFWIRHLVFFLIHHLLFEFGALAPGAQNGGCYLNPPFLGPGELPPGVPKATTYYCCIKRNCKSSLGFYIFDVALLFTNWTERTMCFRGSFVLCFKLEVLNSGSAYVPLCCR